jgi:hypothetical protein
MEAPLSGGYSDRPVSPVAIKTCECTAPSAGVAWGRVAFR